MIAYAAHHAMEVVSSAPTGFRTLVTGAGGKSSASTASKGADIKTMRSFIPRVYFFVTVITDYIFIF